MTLTVTGTSSGNHPLLTRIWAIAGHHLKTSSIRNLTREHQLGMRRSDIIDDDNSIHINSLPD